jgi:uncharacterized protein YyaL (SSP411 family)
MTENFQNTNTLKYSTSPYLLEHADNPVHWHEWSEETLQLAKDLDRPIIISVGYAACHWCHVMADQSFSDTGVAEIMNTHFVCIKVDREERPDIDAIYMNAAQIVSGNGGWPLNAFALPNGKPFYAATYFPKNQWIKLLTQVRNLYHSDRERVEDSANQITQGIKGYEVITLAGDNTEINSKDLDGILPQWKGYVDMEKGGTKGAPKFPLPAGWHFLLDYYTLFQDVQVKQMLIKTLDEMAAGGIYDQIGGGFARYSVDADWLVPHFEKMLYDNGQLLSLYARAYQVFKTPRYKEVVEEIVRFAVRELQHPKGAFYASLNADSEKEEGKYYVWQMNEIKEVLDAKEAALLIEYYSFTESGNWEEGKNIPHTREPLASFAQKHQLVHQDWVAMLLGAKEKMLTYREQRIPPETDTKILVSWNAMMIKGLVDAYQATDHQEYLALAKHAARFILEHMQKEDGSLYHNYAGEKPSIDAFLDDYAFFASALVALYYASYEQHWIEEADKLTQYVMQHFKSGNGDMFYYTSDLATTVVTRKMEISDNVIPASNSEMAHVLHHLGILLDKNEWLDQSVRMMSLVKEKISEGGPYYANWARIMAVKAQVQREVVVTGPTWRETIRKLKPTLPLGTIILGGDQEDLSLLQGRVNPQMLQIFICENKTCGLPLHSVEEVIKELSS